MLAPNDPSLKFENPGCSRTQPEAGRNGDRNRKGSGHKGVRGWHVILLFALVVSCHVVALVMVVWHSASFESIVGAVILCRFSLGRFVLLVRGRRSLGERLIDSL